MGVLQNVLVQWKHRIQHYQQYSSQELVQEQPLQQKGRVAASIMLQRAVLQKQSEAPLCTPMVLQPRGRGSGDATAQTSDWKGLLSALALQAATMAWPGLNHLV